MKTANKGYMTTFKERLSYWTYFVGQNIYYNLTAAFIGVYLTFQGIDPIKSGLVLLIVKIWDAINDPIFGYIFDKVKFKRNQKCLPWLRIAVILIPFVTIFLFSIPIGMSEMGKLIWFGVAYILWDMVYTLTDVPAYSMLNTMTDNLQERNLLLSVNRIFSGAGMVLYNLVIVLTSLGLSNTVAVAIMSVLSGLAMIPLILNCKERNYSAENEDEAFTIGQMFRYLGKNKYLLTYYGGYMATDALKTSAAVTLFLSFYMFQSEMFGVVINLLGMIPGVIAAMLMPTLLKKFDKFRVLFLCHIVSIVLGFVIYFMGYSDKTMFMVLTCIRALPMCIAGVLAFMFTPDCAEYGQYKSGISAKGITFAIQTFSVKITGAVSSSLAMILLGLFGWVSVQAENFAELAEAGVQQSDAALNGLWIVYALVPVIGMVISTFFYLCYKLNDKDVQIMAKCNSGEISREEAESLLSRKY